MPVFGKYPVVSFNIGVDNDRELFWVLDLNLAFLKSELLESVLNKSGQIHVVSLELRRS